MSEVDIIVDSREKYKEYFAHQLRELGWTVRIKALGCGDFYLTAPTSEETYLIERKDTSDFIGSIQGTKGIGGIWTKGRIWSQIDRMIESCDGQLRVLVEGNPFNKRGTAFKKTGMTKVRLWGAEEGIRSRGVPIKYVKNRAETIEYLNYLMKRISRPKVESPLRASSKKSMTIYEQQKYLIQGLPNIGPKASDAVLKHFPTLMDAFNSIDEWKELDGIGPTAVNNIKTVLNGLITQ